MGNLAVNSGFPTQRLIMRKGFPCHYIFMIQTRGHGSKPFNLTMCCCHWLTDLDHNYVISVTQYPGHSIYPIQCHVLVYFVFIVLVFSVHIRFMWCIHTYSRIIPGMVSANGRRRYNVMSSLIGWAHTQNGAWYSPMLLQWYSRNHMLAGASGVLCKEVENGVATMTQNVTKRRP